MRGRNNGEFKIFKLVNFLFGIAFLGYAITVVEQVVNGAVGTYSGGLVTLLLGVQSYGHFFRLRWAMKATAVILSVASIFSAFYLVPSFEKELLPIFSKRFLLFLGLMTSAGIAISCYAMDIRQNTKSFQDKPRKYL